MTRMGTMRVMISCGEASGDLYAGALVAELRRLDPSVEVFGYGGPRLREAGATLVGDFTGATVSGLIQPVLAAPRYIGMLRRMIDAARQMRPDVFVPIDFSGFNFRVMAALRRLGIPIVYYVSPQLWAWRPWRMKAMQAHADRVLVIFPFEEDLYKRAGVPVQFVGHPLVDLARSQQPRASFLLERGLQPAAPTIALLPGSRRNELRRIAPIIAAALPGIRARVAAAQFLVARAPGLPDDLFAPLRECAQVTERADDAIAASDVVITASGTATVQCALHERPMVVVYRVSRVEYLLGRRFLTVDTYAMPNLIAGRQVVPELIQDGFTPERVADEAVALLTDQTRNARMREALRYVRSKLGSPGASARAARAVLDVARSAKTA